MGNVAADFKNKLLETLSSLPEDKQIEVLEFADFVKAKLEAQAAAGEILQDEGAMARLKASGEDVEAGRVVDWRKVIIKDRFGKPTKSIKEIRKVWKDEEMNFAEELVKMRKE